MNNEETKILNNGSTPTPPPFTPQQPAQEAKKASGNNAKRGIAAAAGAAVGAGAAFAANKAYEAYTGNEEEQNDAPAKTEEAHEAKAQKPATKETEEPQEANHPEEAAAVNEVKAPHEPHDPNATPTSAGGEDDEVHVVGVAVQDNGEGGVATIVGIQAGDDSALLVDVESDGTLDYAIHDDNTNGHIEDNEIHDISEANVSTAQVVGTYVEEAHQNGDMAVVHDLDSGHDYQIDQTEDGLQLTSAEEPVYDTPEYDTPVPEDDYCMTSNDDMQDYVNDADPGLMEV